MFKIPFKFLLQRLLGFDNYLFLFSVFSIYRLQYTYYDTEFIHFLNMIPENGQVLDIGSNIGTMSVLMAKKVSRGKVFSFEPIPNHIKALRRVLKKFKTGNVEIFETALGDSSEEITMVMPVIHNVKFQGFSHVAETEADKAKGELFRVPLQKLDDIPALQQLVKIDAIKIDVENFEYPVLKGAENLLRQHQPIIYCELWDNEKRFLTINYLKTQLGYHVKVFEKNRLVDFSSQRVTNYFFIPEGMYQNASPKLT
jgi:FkbM family methyltransferase